jgi:hypothetical protein
MLELFTNPGFLAAGGALVSAPIIIHLINRMRFKRLKWAAMEFLLKSQKRNRRRLIIEQLLLLALRCLLVALTALLVARFAGFSFGSNQAKEITHIVLLDDTLSMNDPWKEGDQAKDCFGVAKAEVEKIGRSLGASTRNDRLAVIVLSKLAVDPGYKPKMFSRLNDKAKMDEFKSDLDGLQASKLHVEMLPAVKKAQEIVANNPQGRVNLHIVSDFRQSDWGLPQAEALKNALLQIAKTPDIEVVLVDTVHPYRLTGQGGVPVSHDNIGLVDLRAGTRVVGKGMPVTFTATVANYSSREARVNIVVSDHSKDKNGEEKFEINFNPPMPLKVPAGATASASFETSFDPQIKARETYFAQLAARLESAQRGKLENDGLAEDNVRYAAVEVRSKVPVLVVDGEGARGRTENQDSFFIKNAIISVPGASYEVVYGDELGNGVAAKALERADLAQYPTIFMLNVRELNPKQLTNLSNYVKDGGGVVFFMGPLVSPEFYNKKLWAKGKGIFPVPIKESYYPPSGEDPRKANYGGNDYQVLLRDSNYAELDLYPIFGSIFKEPQFREVLKDLPVGRYFKVPRSEWRPEPGKVEELVTLPNDKPVTENTQRVLELLQGLDKIVRGSDEYKPYARGLERHRKDLMNLVAPGSEKRSQQLAAEIDAMLYDKGKEKERADYPNLTEFWTNSDPKIRTLREDLLRLREEVLYGDPFVIASNFGKGKVVAVMTTAGKEWNDWGGGSNSSLLYQPFIWELQNYLSSQGSDAYLRVGTPVQVTVDSEQYKQKNRQLKMVRYFMKAQQGKPAQKIVDSEQFGDPKKGELVFNFDKNLEPGLYEAHLVYEDQPGSTSLASWGHVFNVDTPREGKLLRVSGEDLEKNLLKEAGGKIKIESPQSNPDDEAQARNDMSESPWFFLLFLGILVAEQALAVHLSFHLRGGEAEIPAAAAAPRTSSQAA